MEDPSEAQRPAPLGALCPPAAALSLVYSLAILAAYLLEVASRGLVIRAAGPHLPPALSAAWFGHQAATDVAFTVLLPLAVTWTPSCWLLGAAFCCLDAGLALLTFYGPPRTPARGALRPKTGRSPAPRMPRPQGPGNAGQRRASSLRGPRA